MKIQLIFILILVATQAFSKNNLRKTDSNVPEERRLMEASPTFNDDPSKYLQYTKNIGSKAQGTYQAVKGLVVVVIFGGLGTLVNYKLRPALTMADINKAGLGIIASGAMLTWGVKNIFDGVTLYLYQEYAAVNGDGLIDKSM